MLPLDTIGPFIYGDLMVQDDKYEGDINSGRYWGYYGGRYLPIRNYMIYMVNIMVTIYIPTKCGRYWGYLTIL
jgi:hypothetical protein